MGGISVAVVHVTTTYGDVVPGLLTHEAGAVYVVALLTPAGWVQLRSIQLGEVPAVKPGVPHDAAVVKMVWLFTPAGNVQVVS